MALDEIASGLPTGSVQVRVLHGPFAIIDAADLALVSAHKWRSHHGYAWAHKQVDGIVYYFAMHRLLCPTELEVDHINRNTLDNRRVNLRPATRQQQNGNIALRVDNSSGYRGVHRSKGNKWVATIHRDRRTVHLGTFATAAEAARTYDAAAIAHFGEFAWLNFPESSAA